MTILVVEDDDAIREMLAFALADEGYAVVAVHTSEEALAVLTAGEVQLVLLDVMPPSLNAHSLRRRQLADPTLAAIPVLLVSAVPQLDQHAAQLQATAAIPKPFDLDQLLDLVANLYAPPHQRTV